MELEETIKAKEAKFDELRTQLDSFGSVQERQQEGGVSLELYVFNLNQEIRDLKRAKDDCRKIGTFTKLAGSYEAAREEYGNAGPPYQTPYEENTRRLRRRYKAPSSWAQSYSWPPRPSLFCVLVR